MHNSGSVDLSEVEISILGAPSRRRCPGAFFSRQLGAHQATVINAPETIEPEQRAPRFAPERLPIQLARDFQLRSCESAMMIHDLNRNTGAHVPNQIIMVLRTAIVIDMYV